MDRTRYLKVITMFLLGAGIFQILAALLALFFWLVAGDWRPFWPHIAGIAFWLNLPVSYWLWRTYWRSHSHRE